MTHTRPRRTLTVYGQKAHELDEPHNCDRCGQLYDEADGDGYCGLCPRCADRDDD